MRGGRLRPILPVGVGAAALSLSACGLSLVLGSPDGFAEDAGADAFQSPRDAYVPGDANHRDATTDGAASADASSDVGADGTATSDAGSDADAGKATRRVFVSATAYSGMQIGGLAGGDTLCQVEATAALLGGTWHAILGQNETYAAIIARIGNRADPIVRIDKKPVVDDITKLLTVTPVLDNNITLDATGKASAAALVWTGISAGAANTGASTNHCVKWASAAANQMGVWGKAAQKDFEFLMQNATMGVDTCDQKHRIYCLEE